MKTDVLCGLHPDARACQIKQVISGGIQLWNRCSLTWTAACSRATRAAITRWASFLILGIVGIVLGVKARKQAPSGIATAGFVCSIVGTALSAALLVCALCALGALASLGAAAANM